MLDCERLRMLYLVSPTCGASKAKPRGQHKHQSQSNQACLRGVSQKPVERIRGIMKPE